MHRSPEYVAVFGGAGNMGQLTVGLFRDLGYRPIVVDPRDSNSPDPADAIRSSGIIFFSVLPIEETGGIILGNKDLFNKRHVVLDNATVKRPFREAYQRLLQKGVSICSTHPLCKHDQPLYGQKALVMPVGDNATEARRIGESIYGNAGMKLIDFPFERHDQSMLVIQGLPHLVHRAVGMALARMGLDMGSLYGIATANSQLYLLSMWRTLLQEPEISDAIIANLSGTPEGQNVIANVQASLGEVIGANDRNELRVSFRRTYADLGGEELGPGMRQTTTAVLEMLAHLSEPERSMVTATTGAADSRT